MGMLLNPVCVPMIRISIVGWMTLGQMPSFDHDSCGFIWKYAIPQFNTWSSLSPSFWAVLRYTTHFQTNECWPILMGQLQVLLELSETLLLWIVFLSWTSGHSSRSNNPRVVTSNNWGHSQPELGTEPPIMGRTIKNWSLSPAQCEPPIAQRSATSQWPPDVRHGFRLHCEGRLVLHVLFMATCALES